MSASCAKAATRLNTLLLLSRNALPAAFARSSPARQAQLHRRKVCSARPTMTNFTHVNTRDAPEALGPYSQAVVANGLVFCSGQIPIDPKTNGLVPADIKLQTRQCLKNLTAVLKEAGSSLDQVAKVTVFLKDMNNFAAMNEVYAEEFGSARPARAAVEVARLPKDVMVEIECTAVLKA